MAAPDPNIALTDTDEAALLRLSADDRADHVQEILEEIAARHKANWRGWQEWGPRGRPCLSLLAWLSSRPESRAYEALVEFSVRCFFPTLNEPAAARWLLVHFADSLYAMAKLAEVPDTPETSFFRNRACNAIASVIASRGPSRACHLRDALEAATFNRLTGWMVEGWAIASADFDAAAIDEIAAVPDRAGGSKRQ